MIKTLIGVSDLDRAFGAAVLAEHVQRIHEAAPPLTREQTTFQTSTIGLLVVVILDVAVQGNLVVDRTRMLFLSDTERRRLDTAVVVINVFGSVLGSFLAGSLWQAGDRYVIVLGSSCRHPFPGTRRGPRDRPEAGLGPRSGTPTGHARGYLTGTATERTRALTVNSWNRRTKRGSS